MDSTQVGLFDSDEGGEQLTLGLYAEQAYLDYAVSVVPCSVVFCMPWTPWVWGRAPSL